MKQIRGIDDQISQARLTKATAMHLISVLPNPDLVNFYDYVSLSSMITDANTAVSEVPIGRDVIAAVCGHAVIDESDEEA